MSNANQNGSNRKNIQIGQQVAIVQKQDQRTGKLTEGIVQRILTKSVTHPQTARLICGSTLEWVALLTQK